LSLLLQVTKWNNISIYVLIIDSVQLQSEATEAVIKEHLASMLKFAPFVERKRSKDVQDGGDNA